MYGLINPRSKVDEWLQTQVFQHSPLSNREILIKSMSYGLSGLASAVLFPLAQHSGENFINDESQDSHALKVLTGYLAGATGFATGAVLAAKIAEDIFLGIFSKPAEIADLHEKHPPHSPTQIANYFLWIFSVVAAMPETDLSLESYYKSIGLVAMVFAASTLIVLTTQNAFGMQRVVDKQLGNNLMNLRLYLGSPAKQKDLLTRKMIQDALAHSLMALNAMSSNEMKSLERKLFDERIPIDNKLSMIMDMTRQLESTAVAVKGKTSRLVPLTEKGAFAETVGAVVGGLSSACFFPLSSNAGTHLMSSLGVDNPMMSQGVSAYFGVSALIFRGALNVYTGALAFKKYYSYADKFLNSCAKSTNSSASQSTLVTNSTDRSKLRQCLLSALYPAAFIFSLSGGAVRAGMVSKGFPEEEWYKSLLLATAFLGGTSLYYWALSAMVGSVVDSDPVKEKLQQCIVRIQEASKTLTPNMADELFNKLELDGAELQELVQELDNKYTTHSRQLL